MLERNNAKPLADLISTANRMIESAACRNERQMHDDAKLLCDHVNAGRGGSIAKADLLKDTDGSVVVGLMFDWQPDTDEKPAPQNPRIFDVLFFVALLLMTAAGARIYFHDPKRKGTLEYYLRMGPYGSPAPGERIYIARIIRNTPAGIATPFAIEHHSYRYVHLDQAPPFNNLPAPHVGRPEADARRRSRLLGSSLRLLIRTALTESPLMILRKHSRVS